ncbi:hypothetical protein FJTKL_02299 [Diaporthe vaccinii]|uniref:Uncharacterized protein n=1 Tax=Diaporthe vaccinii TaxID=105482 RepID=A0ABR4F3N3_9PEZI
MISAALAKDWIDLGDDHPSRMSIESLLRDPPAASATVRPRLDQSIPGDLGLQALTLQPGGPAPNPPAAPAQDVPDPVGPAPIPVAVYAGPNGFYTRVGDSGGILHELEVHKNGHGNSFVVLRDIRTYVVDVGAADPAARGSPATPIPVSTHAGQDGRAYATAWRPGFSVEELAVHTDMTNNTHYVEFDGRRTSILLMAGMPPRQA